MDMGVALAIRPIRKLMSRASIARPSCRVLVAELGPLSADEIDPHQWIYARDGVKIVVNSNIQDGFTSAWVVGASCVRAKSLTCSSRTPRPHRVV
jgi:hypothetical protein